ncbi:hypothetical protein K491DRAFT_449449 [Lophiostoma macrostomum CBS 122681]|uniref:Uncharacterized protein n=1 Tax=Lophiostoma macrostomum CBS 122681 TaxID=1314788 RepID=A0A6A6TQ68_9PLEO|nr:hypothetical protein K491DRAFT_449449 [Lophiostoma macrostomum CBS 122681]
MNHSEHMEHFCLRLDMLGIVIFILGDLVLGIYMIFWCEPLLRNIYWSMIGVCGTSIIFMTMYPQVQGPQYRLFRVLMFVATGLSGLSLYFGKSRMPSIWTLFYAVRFPERRYPGKFDLWGSHSIFHVPVVCAAVVQITGYVDAFDYAHTNLTCSTSSL